MESHELKTAVLALLDGGSAWCKNANAVDGSGNRISPLHPDAVSWDLMGAIIKAFEGETDYTSYHLVIKDFTDAIPLSFKSRDIEAWNDDADWSDISQAIASVPLMMYAGVGETMTAQLED